MTFITKKALPRRTVLRGMGTMVALPFLGAMAPCFFGLVATLQGKPDSSLGILLCAEWNVSTKFPP